MHTLLRRCLLLLLCLALPFSALQSIAAPATPCPMQASGMSKATMLAHDCCAEHAKPCCPAGQHCQSANLLLISLSAAPALSLSRPLLAMSSVELHPVQSANGLWRPPRR
jgi:hypothetical protein